MKWWILAACGAALALPEVSLLFLTVEGMKFLDLWESWYEDAVREMKVLGLEGRLKGFGTARRGFESKFASWIGGVVEAPTEGVSWGVPNRAVHKLLEFALKRSDAKDGYYILVSDTSVPVKPFIEIYAEIVGDDRTRFSLWVMNVERYCMPKTSAWYSLSREHAELLARFPDAWCGKGWLSTDYKPSYSKVLVGRTLAEDEFYTFRGLLSLLAPRQWATGLYQKTIKGKKPSLNRSWWPWSKENDRPRPRWEEYGPQAQPPPRPEDEEDNDVEKNCLSEAVFPDSIKLTVQHVPDFRSQQFVWWYNMPVETSGRYIGYGLASEGHPLEFIEVEAGLLYYLNSQVGVWFARKFNEGNFTKVIGEESCQTYSESKHYKNWIGLNDQIVTDPISFRDIPAYNPYIGPGPDRNSFRQPTNSCSFESFMINSIYHQK